MARVKMTEALRDEILALKADNKSIREISSQVGLGYSTVDKALRYGFKTLVVTHCRNCGGPTKSKYGYCQNTESCSALYFQKAHESHTQKPNYRIRVNASLRKYSTGMSAAMWNECWELQNGKCGHCAVELSTLDSKHLNADHEPNSEPKKPRGILCFRCNSHWLGVIEKLERDGRVIITDPEVIAWQTNPPMARSSFAVELGWTTETSGVT